MAKAVYLVHYKRPRGHIRHAVRWVEAPAGTIRTLYRQLDKLPIDCRAKAQGIAFVLVRIWKGRDGGFERKLKDQKHQRPERDGEQGQHHAEQATHAQCDAKGVDALQAQGCHTGFQTRVCPPHRTGRGEPNPCHPSCRPAPALRCSNRIWRSMIWRLPMTVVQLRSACFQTTPYCAFALPKSLRPDTFTMQRENGRSQVRNS